MGRYLIVALFLHLGFLCLWIFFGQGSLQLSRFHDNEQFPTQSPAGLARDTAFELEGLLREPVRIWDFATMANRIVKFGVLADLTITEKTMDEGVIFSLLGKHFPWWQPDRSTYMPWHRRPKSDVHDTGIVICVGSRTKIYAIHLIRILRDVLHSKLPIEIAYGGDGDLPFKDRHDFMAMDDDIRLVNLVDLFDESVGSLRHGGFAMKPFAMLASRFRRVIMADADAIFLRAPDQLFKTEPGLVETGTFFWHDRAFKLRTVSRQRWVASLLGTQGPSPSLSQTAFWTDGLAEQQDSAVVCIDKGRPKVFMSLLFSVWMNLKVVRDHVTYRNTHGESLRSMIADHHFLLLCSKSLANVDLQATKNHSGSRPNSPKHRTTSVLGMPAVLASSRTTPPFVEVKQASAIVVEISSGTMVQCGATNGNRAVNS